MPDLRSLSLDDMYRFSAEIRDIGEKANDSDDAARRIVSYLFEQLRFPETGAPECALVRFFRSKPLASVAPADAAKVIRGGGDTTGSSVCLSLRATRGVEREWNDPSMSRRHRLLPLGSPEALSKMPMVSALVSQLAIPTAVLSGSSREHADDIQLFDVFHVEEAHGSPSVPDQDAFVDPYGIASVVGFGGMLPPSEVFVVVMFSTAKISRTIAERFRILAPSIGLALLSSERDPDSLETRARGYELIVRYHEEMGLRQNRELERIASALAVSFAERQQFEALVENSSDFIGIATAEGTPIYLNPAGRRMIGLDAAFDVGKTHMTEYYPAEAGHSMQEILASTLAEGGWSGETALRHWKTGASIPVSDEHFVIRQTKSGRLLGIGCIMRDISEKRRSEEQRERLLASAQEARAAAQAASRAKDEFLAVLGHELRNPLSPILTAVELMKLRGARSREQEVIERQASHLARLVDDLLDVARIARGKIEVKKRPVEIAKIVARAVEMSSPRLEQRKQRLTIDVPREGLIVNGDVGRLAQVVSNLLDNASKYSATGTEVTVSAVRSGERVHLSVRDQGAGIPSNMLDRIFESFVQHRAADATSAAPATGSVAGLGLGLTIVRSLVELHGGNVHACSAGPGRGSELIVELPLMTKEVREAAAPPREPPTGPEAAEHCKRVLLVDDNVDAANTLAEALTEVGHEVLVAKDGPSALAAAPAFRPDVALLDIGLPLMDGYELGRRLRALPGMPDDMRLIALTGYGQEGDRQRSMEAGFAAHLVKPIALEGVMQAVRA